MDLKNNNISKMKYQSIYIVIALTFMFAPQVFGQSSNIKNATMVLQTRINLEIKPTVTLKKEVLNNNTSQHHIYYHAVKTQSFDTETQMKIKVRKPKESLPIKKVVPASKKVQENQQSPSTINVKEIKLVKSTTLNTQINPSIKVKKKGALIKNRSIENSNGDPVSRKINEK